MKTLLYYWGTGLFLGVHTPYWPYHFTIQLFYYKLSVILLYPMLTKEEESFLNWWQQHREQQKKIRNRWFVGLPAGLLLGLPVLLNVFAKWNKQVEVITGGQMIAVLIAILGIITFMAVFSIQHKWEMREQLYRELLQKKNTSEQPESKTD